MIVALPRSLKNCGAVQPGKTDPCLHILLPCRTVHFVLYIIPRKAVAYTILLLTVRTRVIKIEISSQMNLQTTVLLWLEWVGCS